MMHNKHNIATSFPPILLQIDAFYYYYYYFSALTAIKSLWYISTNWKYSHLNFLALILTIDYISIHSRSLNLFLFVTSHIFTSPIDVKARDTVKYT